jgi:hypothetical protein
MPTCPSCGRDLVELDPPPNSQSAPWTCYPCVRGWWPAELTLAARECWDSVRRSFRAGEAGSVVRNAAIVQAAEARERARA